MKKGYIFLGLSAALLLFALNVSAADFVFPQKENGKNVAISESLENIYTAGNVVSIDSNVKKGLHVVGNTINLNADVEGIFCAAGRTIIEKGNVGGTVYAAGENIFIEGLIGDDLFAGGGSIFLAENSSVNGDLIAAGGSVTVNGSVGRNVFLAAKEAVINGKVNGNVKVKSAKLVLGGNAEIEGNLDYTSEKEADIDKSKVSGEVIFHQKKMTKGVGFSSIMFFLKLLGAIAAGLVFVYLLKNFTREIVKNSLKKFWANLGMGFAALILIPVTCIILAFSGIGLVMAGIIIPLYIFLVVLASVFTGIIIGAWLIKLLTKKQEYAIDWKAVVLGVAITSILAFVPFIGWLAIFIFLLIGLGALVQWVYNKIIIS